MSKEAAQAAVLRTPQSQYNHDQEPRLWRISITMFRHNIQSWKFFGKKGFFIFSTIATLGPTDTIVFYFFNFVLFGWTDGIGLVGFKCASSWLHSMWLYKRKKSEQQMGKHIHILSIYKLFFLIRSFQHNKEKKLKMNMAFRGMEKFAPTYIYIYMQGCTKNVSHLNN